MSQSGGSSALAGLPLVLRIKRVGRNSKMTRCVSRASKSAGPKPSSSSSRKSPFSRGPWTACPRAHLITSQVVMGLGRNLRDRIPLALIAIVGREAQAVAREVRQRLVNRVGVEDEEVAGLEFVRHPVVARVR